MKNFYRDGGLVISVTALVVALAVLQGYVYTKDIKIFWISAPFVSTKGSEDRRNSGGLGYQLREGFC